MGRRKAAEEETGPPLFGRSVARELVTLHAADASPPLICFWGVTRIGKTELLSRIVRDQRQAGRKAVLVDLREQATPDRAAEEIWKYLRSQRRRWLMTRLAMLQQQIDEDRSSTARTAALDAAGTVARMLVQGAAGTHPVGLVPTALSLPAKLWRGMRPVGRRLWRRKQRRWIRERQLPKPSDVPSERRKRLRALYGLVPKALAADLVEVVGRRPGIDRLVLLFDHHDDAGDTLGGAVRTDFVETLATALRAASAPVLVVVGRNRPFEPDAGSPFAEGAGRDDDGVLQSPALLQRRLEPLNEIEALEYLDHLGLPPERRRALVAATGGHPYALELAGKSGAMPSGPHGTARPSDEAMVQTILGDTLDGLMRERSSEERRLLLLASTVRFFDLRMLTSLMERPVPIEDVEEETRCGVIRSLGEVDGERVWRIDPALRVLIVRRLVARDDRELYLDGNRRALAHLRGLDVGEDEELRFARRIEQLYHEAAIEPERGLDELGRLADEELAQYRLEHAQTIISAIEDLPSFEHDTTTRAALVRVKRLSDLHAHRAVRRTLDRAAREHPLDESPTPTAFAVQLELGKADRLRGCYRDALRRYERVAALADKHDLLAVAFHAAWELSLVYKQLDELPQAFDQLDRAQARLDEALARGGRYAARAARRYGIRDLDLKPAHIARHEAELRRLMGDYVGAHAAVERSIELNDAREPRAVLHTRVVRSQILRVEGYFAEAVAEAAEARAEGERADPPEERLYLFATRSEVLARINLGDLEEARPQIEQLLTADTEIYPSAVWSGWLARGELQRREGRAAEAERSYERAEREAHRLGNQAGRATALIGLLECRRSVGAAFAAELDTLLALRCLEVEPWLAVRAELLRGVMREPDRAAALDRAAAVAADRFVRRGDTPDRDGQLVARVRAELAEGAVGSIALEVL